MLKHFFNNFSYLRGELTMGGGGVKRDNNSIINFVVFHFFYN